MIAIAARPEYNPGVLISTDSSPIPMEKRPSPLILFLVIFACFSAGLFSVWVRQGRSQPSSSPSGQATTILTQGAPSINDPQPQTTILVMGINDLQSEHPELLAIWYIAFRPPGEGVFLFGLPTDSPVDGDQNVTLRDLFFWSADQGIDSAFLDALAQHVPLTPEIYAMLDEVAFAALIDYLGGVTLEGAQLQGNQVIGVLRLISDQPGASLATQREVLRAMSEKVHLLGSNPDVTQLIELIPSHAFCSAPPMQLMAAVSPLLPLDSTSVFLDTLQEDG